MSTELKSNTPDVSLTRFRGATGSEIQVTTERSGQFQFIQLTREQAASLATDLLDFAQRREVSLEEV